MDIYRVTSWGKPVNVGVTNASFVEVSAIGKTNALPQDPYFVANELISAELGRMLKLPVPPGFVIMDGGQTPYFASLEFNLTGVALPPILPDQFAARFLPQIGTILVFDIFIGNSDRHARNISADYANPPRFNLFDHSHTLLGGSHHGAVGAARLQAAEGALVIDGGIGGNRHALIDRIQDDATFGQPLGRLASIPDFFIRETVAAGSDLGVGAHELRLLTDFLLARRGRVRDIIANNKAAFPGIRHWGLL